MFRTRFEIIRFYLSRLPVGNKNNSHAFVHKQHENKEKKQNMPAFHIF